MSGANPVETKADAANPAAALNAPAPAAAPAGGRLWARLVRHKTLGLAVGGSALVLVSGWYGLTHFSPAPATAVAQSDPAADPTPPEPKAEEPVKRTDPTPGSALDIAVPAVPVVSTDQVPAGKPAELDPLVLTPPTASDRSNDRTATDIASPPILPPTTGNDKTDTARPKLTATNGTSAGAVTAPPIPEVEVPADDKKKPPTEDPFKTPGGLPDSDRKKPDGPPTGPAPLPTDMADRKDTSDVKAPVIRSGGTADVAGPPAPAAPMPEKKADPTAPPPVPMLDLDVPLPPVPMTDKADTVKPPAADRKDDELPTLIIPKRPGPAGPDSKKDDTPTIPKIDLTAPDAVKPPAISLDPPAGPSGPPADPKKKAAFDEDWHTPRAGDNFVLISQEYFHDAKYAPALEAYNKRKADGIIRVPPTWVLEEQFPNLVQKADKADRPGVPEAKPTGNIRFEPAVSPAPGSRPAPPAAVGPRPTSNDEYRVTAPDGEMVREVARKVFGDPNAWRRIGSLNPDLDPTLPIPAGTTLLLDFRSLCLFLSVFSVFSVVNFFFSGFHFPTGRPVG